MLLPSVVNRFLIRFQTDCAHFRLMVVFGLANIDGIFKSPIWGISSQWVLADIQS